MKLKRLLQKAVILPLIGIAVMPLLIFSAPLASGEGHAEDPMELFDRLAERAERGELTLRETFEALGKPLCMVPIEFWDDKVSREDVRNIARYFHGTAESVSAEELDGVVAHLVERAKGGELTLREKFEALGEPLCPTIPIEFWDAKVSMGPVRRIELRCLETPDWIRNDSPGAGTVQPLVLMQVWSGINKRGHTEISHFSATWTSRDMTWLSVTSNLIGPMGNTVSDSGFFTNFVFAWDFVPVLPAGTYWTWGSHQWFCPFAWPPFGTVDTFSPVVTLP